jgi:Uma2 family endonuclease
VGLALQKQETVGFDRDSYLAWEAEQDAKHEYQRGEIVAMVGVRLNHARVSGALYARLREHLRGGPCEAFTADVKLLIEAADAYFYPDVMVSCSAADRQAELALTAPCLIAEVLSASTAGRDRGAKFVAHRLIPSLRDYLVIDPERRRIELYSRANEGWLLRETGPGEPGLPLDSIGLTLAAEEVFADLPALSAPPGIESDPPHGDDAH